MKIKSCLVIFYILLTVQLQAQNKTLSIKIGEPEKKGLLTGLLGVVGTTDNGFYILRSKSKGFTLNRMAVGTKGELFLDLYDNNLKLKNSIPIKNIPVAILNKAKDKSFEFFTQDVNQNLWLFYSDESSGKNQLYKKMLNPNTNSFNEPILVAEHKIMSKGLDKRSTYNVIISENKEYIAVYSFTGNKKSTDSYVYVEIFDNNLNSKWKINTTIPEYQKGTFVSKAYGMLNEANTRVSLSNNGILNIISEAYSKEAKYSKKEYVGIIYSFQDGKEKPEIKILDDEQIMDLTLVHDHEQNSGLKMVGFYTDDKKGKTVDGIVFKTFDPSSLETLDEKFIPFNTEHKKAFLISDNTNFKSEAKKDSRIEKKIKQDKNIDIPSRNNIIGIYLNKDNSLTIASEYFYVYTTYTTTSRGSDGITNQKPITNYFFGDLTFINLSEKGDINWIKNYDKKQTGASKFISGVYDMFLDDTVYFLYNDILNKDLKISSINSSSDINSEVITTLGKKGKLEGFFISTKHITKLKDDSYIAIGFKILNSRLVKLSLK